MSFLKKIFGKGTNIDPLDSELKEKIKRIVIGQLDNYGKNYRQEFQNVSDEWKEAGKEFSFDEVDKEAHNRAGLESFKDTASNKVNDEIEDDIERNIRKQTDNDIVVTASKKTAEKSVDIMVSKLIDESIEKLRKEEKAE